MSESFKMGLFGSKDKNKDIKKEPGKEGSPDRYAPYCIDSDSETYDTEALSIMDINDIIGVQSEPVSDSTLESEIAALSQIITESKSEASQSAMDNKVDSLENDSDDQQFAGLENLEVETTSIAAKNAMEELESVCSAVQMRDVCDNGLLSIEKTESSSENNVLGDMELNGQTYSGGTDLKDDCESSLLMESSPAAIINESSTEDRPASIEDINVMDKLDAETAQLMDTAIAAVSECTNIEDSISVLKQQVDQQIDLQVNEQTDHCFDQQVDDAANQQMIQQVDEQLDQQANKEVNQQADEQPDQQPNQEVNQQVDGQLDEQENQQVDQPADEQPDQPTTQQLDQSANEQLNQPADQQVDQQADEQVDQPADQQVDQQADEQLNQPANQQVDQEADKHDDREVNNPIDQENDEQLDQQIDQQTNQQIDQQTSQQLDQETNQQIDQQTDQQVEQVNEQVNSADFETSDTQSDKKTVESMSGITGSLQLIGEAYTSEDSQETCTNDSESKEEGVTNSFSDKPTIEHEEEKGLSETVCEPQQNVDDIIEAPSDVNLKETSVEESVPVKVNEDQPQNTEAEISNECVQQSTAKETLSVSEDIKEDVPNSENEGDLCLSSDKDELMEIVNNVTDLEIMKENVCEQKLSNIVIEESIRAEENAEIEKSPLTTPALEDATEEAADLEKNIIAENQETAAINDEPKLPHSAECQESDSNISETVTNLNNDDISSATELINNELLQSDNNSEIANNINVCAENVDTEPERKEESPICESEKPESMDTTDDSSIPQNVCSALESLQMEQELNNKEVEDVEAMQDDSLKSFINQLDTDANIPVDSVENSNYSVKEKSDLILETESLLNNALNTIDNTVAEIETNIQNAHNINQESIECEKNIPQVEPMESSIELPETKIEDETEIPTLIDSTDTDPVLEPEMQLPVPSSIETNTPENQVEGIQLAEKVEDTMQDVVENKTEEIFDAAVSKTEDDLPEENESEEVPDEKQLDTFVNQDANPIEESVKPEEPTTPLIQDELKLEFPEDTQLNVQPSSKEEEPQLSSLISMVPEESVDHSISSPPQLSEFEELSEGNIEENLEKPTIPMVIEENVQSIEQSDTDTNKEDIKEDTIDNDDNEEMKEDSTNDDELASLKFTGKDVLSPPSDQTELVLPEEDAEEERIEEEMNLTLEPEEAELQPEVAMDKICEERNIIATTEESNKEIDTIEDVNISDMRSAASGLLDLEEKVAITANLEDASCSENIELSMLEKTTELLEKQNIEDNLKSEVENNNLKSILETANNVAEMFSEEQCQNTQDIVTSILDNVENVTDFKNILGTEAEVEHEIEEVLQQSGSLPLGEADMEELTEKLPQNSDDILNKDMDDSMSAQNIDSLEGLLGLDLMPESEDSTQKVTKTDEKTQDEEALDKDVHMALLLEESNRSSDIAQASDYISDVISSCLTNTDNVSLESNTGKTNVVEDINDKSEESVASKLLKERLMNESIAKETAVADIQKHLEEDNVLPETDLDMDFEENPLGAVGDLDEAESKLDLAPDMLLQNVDTAENLNDTPSGIETSQPSSEISELESAVKFLQESEEQAIDSPLVLSPKMVESVVEGITKETDAAALFVPDEDICEDTSELVAELQDIATDSISISEAEIISEAAKLESERKLAEQVKISSSPLPDFESNDIKLNIDEVKNIANEAEVKFGTQEIENIEIQRNAPCIETDIIRTELPMLSQNVLKVSEPIPKVSILEERLKEPPKIEIPTTEVTKVPMSPTTSKDSLLIQKDAKIIAFQKMLESPKLMEKTELKIMDTPRKDSEKHDFENVGSPRIILKIAKSAIADCSEPRSPKSPKIRSATNSPNPEDSPGQKLGKIKLKLSKGGHPSIISNENIEEAGQWHSEGSASLSPIGMKIKLSKSGDASIVSSEKHESVDDTKEVKHKFEEAKRTESPIGMKIKLSKTGDASIVQQDSKEVTMKHKEKLDIVQGSPKRTESPIGMKIKLSKSGDASIIQPDRQDFGEEHRENTSKGKEKLDMSYDSPKRTDSPIGMKIKLSKTGDASIVFPDMSEEGKDTNTKLKEKLESPPEIPKRTESPIGMKIKLSKTKGGASIISVENTEDAKEKLDIPDIPKRTESPLGMKIKLSKTGDASIIHTETPDESKETKQKEKADNKEKTDTLQDTLKSSESLCSMKIKVTKVGETSVISQDSVEETEVPQEATQKVESPIGMKIKLSKFGDASIVPTDKQEQVDENKTRESLQDTPKRTESPIGMKIKLSKTGDASIIQSEIPEDPSKTTRTADSEHSKTADSSLGMKIKLLKTGDASIVESDKKDRQQKRRDTESPLEMKIKLSKTGHPTIVACDSHTDSASHNFVQRYKDPVTHKEPALKILKGGPSAILQSNRSELTIEPVQMQAKKMENAIDISPKRKEITISPIESKKSKLETQLSQILPEVTIQPVMTRDQKQLLFDPKTSLISRQQMNVISQEISITQVRPSKAADTSMSEKLKDILAKNVSGSPMNSDCEIIEHRPELIIVNENSNSSQDVVIIEEVNRMPEVKVPKKRGRPRRIPLPQPIAHPPPQILMPRDPLALDETPQAAQFEHRENERPKRTCRSQKSYAPPKRGRGRGRGKRKLENLDLHLAKKPRVDQDLSAIEASTMAVITIDDPSMQQGPLEKSSELYKALKQPPMDCKGANPACKMEKQCMGHKDGMKNMDAPNSALSESAMAMQLEAGRMTDIQGESSKMMPKPATGILDSKDIRKSGEIIPEKGQRTMQKPGHPNWLTPTSKRHTEGAARQESVSTVQVIDEETRMSAESGSRSQTPARNISIPASDTIVNEESQGSVLSTATTESEKVKVKNRRMEINFDPDEGPFTVDKIAEYEWPLDRKGETFMIQEQISQYLGVKSFKRKYPDLKRRMVDMEERNYLRENGLVSEAMCDMGLTAVCSSEVLDVMCSDFPDQYEEYRKHMREKQVKEHSKKQKELTAAANAEKNRIDLAEMAVQSALSWNVSLNKARRENRKCSLDLQTFTIHVPKKEQKIDTEQKISHYPVALIPGQYTDYYREYTAAELRYYPLNTVLYGPMRPNERKFDSQSEGSQSDSDSDSSSDDSSSSSSEGTQDTEGSQSTMDEVDMEIVTQKDEVKLKCKMCLKTLNKHSKNEVLIQCGTCNGNVHPSCIDLTLDMVPHIQSYSWQCTDCKTCAQCHDPADEDKMLFCDMCDRGYHIYCVGLRRVPQGRWHCQECAVCANCGSREPGGINSDRNSVAQWQHEYKKGDKNTRVYVSTLCVPCSKLWRKGRYCPHCSRCHTAPRLDLEANLVHCSACDKYLHLGCVEIKGSGFDRKNYLCDFCTPNRQQVVKPLVSKIFKT